MARFDVYRGLSRDKPFVVDVQSNILRVLSTRVVVPLGRLTPDSDEFLPRLKPKITVAGSDFMFLATDIAVIPAGRLRDPIANIEAHHRDDITRALDFLFQGF